MSGCSTPLTVTRRQARTMLDAVKAAKRAAEISDPDLNPGRDDEIRDLERARLMLAAALERIKAAEDRAGIRVAA